MRKLYLDKLKQGQSGITPNVASFLVEAALFCLMENGHTAGTTIKVTGDFQEEFELVWTGEVTDQMRKTWNDQKEATEYGATAIAALLITELINFEILLRSEQGNFVDFGIGKPDSIQLSAHMEVSGIWKETSKNSLNVRVNKKIKQVAKRQDDLPVFVLVTEFDAPSSKIIKHG